MHGILCKTKEVINNGYVSKKRYEKKQKDG